ncbi:hypothetical protein [Rubrivirga sp. IMCC45206]|uniref:hypothetical protein n=1 Tax=Rubrivirga sp. IMCC45206 TaxID=3391614 RepID=UPI0039903622
MRALVLGLLLIGCDAAVEPAPALGAPTSLGVASATPTTVTLRWRAPEAPVDGFEIRTGCTAACPALYPEVLATVGLGYLSYRVEGLVDVEPRQFQVVAVRDGAREGSEAVRVEYPADARRSGRPLPGPGPAYLAHDGDYAYQPSPPDTTVWKVDVRTGAVVRRYDGYDTVLATIARYGAIGDEGVFVYASGAPPGEVGYAAYFLERVIQPAGYRMPDGPVLIDTPGAAGLVAAPAQPSVLMASSEVAGGRHLTAWIRQGVATGPDPVVVSGFESMLPIGVTSATGRAFLLDPLTGRLHGVTLNGGDAPPQTAWTVETGWREGSGAVPQFYQRRIDLAFTAGGQHRVVDGLDGSGILAVAAGPREQVVAFSNGWVVVSDGTTLAFVDGETGAPLRRIPEQPDDLDGRLANEGRHVIAVSGATATVIVSENGVRSVRRWVLDATWREAPAQ